jgi:lipopolysaccharide export system protein LptA
MRNTQAARYARWSAMISMFLIVLVGAVYMRHFWQTRLLHMAMPPAVPSSVRQQSAEFSFSKETGNRTEFTIRASHATQFNQGGRGVLQDVWLTAYGRDGSRLDTLRTHLCEYFESDGRMTCAGEVEIDLESSRDAQAYAGRHGKPDLDPNVIHVVTSNISFDRDSGVATTPAALRFQLGQMEGRAVGFRYDAGQGEVRLLHDVALTSHRSAIASPRTPRDSGKAVVAGADELRVTGSALLFERTERTLYLSGPVKAQQGSYELSAGQLNVELDERLRPHRVVAHEHPEFHMSGNRPVAISADEFSAPFAENGSLARIVAQGSVRARASGPVDDNRLDAAMAEIELVTGTSQPRLFTATGDVRAQSDSGAGVSRLITPKLEVTFVARSNNADPTLHIGVATASAAMFDYEEAVAPPKAPASPPPSSSFSVPSASRRAHIHLVAHRLDALFGAENEVREIHGSGGVELERREHGPSQDSTPETSTGRDMVAHFGADGLWSSIDETGDVHLRQGDAEAQSDRGLFERLTDTATLSGSVVVTNGGWRTTSQFATFRQSSNEIRAEGRVATSQLGTSPSIMSLGAGPAHLSGDRLVFDTASGHAIYSGHARLWQGTSVVEADIVELDRSTQTLTATDHVRVIFPQAAWEPQQTPRPAAPKAGPNPGARTEFWRAEAGRMIYESSKGQARLEQTVRAHSTEGTLRADSMDLFFSAQGPSRYGPAGATSAAIVVGPAGSPGGANGEKELSKALAWGHVLLDQGSLHGTGERAEYTASEGKFVLSGGPPRVYDELGNSTSGRQLTLFFADDKILVDSELGLRTLTMHRVEK